MKTDSLRNFTVRFLESALRRVESTAKPFYGGRLSTGEAIRRLAEERLDEIESSSPRESTRDALLRMVGAWRSGQSLALDDLRLLAQLANKAYQRCRQDFVSRDLLIGNVSAFRDVIRMVNRGKGRGIEPEERYFLGNLLTSEMIDAKTLIEYVDKWIALLEDRPSSMQAEFASRNLWTYLRDEEFSDESQIAKLLAQYVSDLLQVAIRGYWNSERETLIERPKGSPPSDEPPRMISPTCVGAITLRTFVQEYGLAATIELTAQNCSVAIRNVVELEDLATVTQLARTGSDARGATFAWSIHGDNSKSYVLSSERAWWRLAPADFASFAQCVDSLLREPSMAALIERLRYVYGRV